MWPRRSTSRGCFLVFILLCIIDANATQYCEHLHQCLDRLTDKERECLKFPISDDGLSDCQKKEKRKLRMELGDLQLQKTELLAGCVAASDVQDDEQPLDSAKERKCRSAADKMEIIAEVLLSQRGLSRQKRKKQNGKQIVKFCRRSRKMLQRKCKALSKCCSTSTE
ncbi:hypothetical protein M3Y98_00926200 [Aphelenchoides besseyi]|nr:hypothetical protein M3Y98_00926200 [Aphelenchoides besseyi]KAI6194192.1 hypothetical protein M3Y96_01098600 [Aphelenchoides besseyi]KAI6194193.1 hypothetical protein M3Y96_01098700 [Aphelenchoides besseyi]